MIPEPKYEKHDTHAVLMDVGVWLAVYEILNLVFAIQYHPDLGIVVLSFIVFPAIAAIFFIFGAHNDYPAK